MPTPKQIAARRLNIRKSQGPSTEAGKTVSSKNALKFGFYARDPVVAGESRDEWNAFRSEMLGSLCPLNAEENRLAEVAIDAAWRMRRIAVVEAAVFNHAFKLDEQQYYKNAADALVPGSWGVYPRDAEDPAKSRELLDLADAARVAADNPEFTMGRVFRRDAEESSVFGKLARFEGSIRTTMLRSLQLLEVLQEKRIKRVKRIPAARATLQKQNEVTEDLNPVKAVA